jgi:hypothetical protein
MSLGVEETIDEARSPCSSSLNGGAPSIDFSGSEGCSVASFGRDLTRIVSSLVGSGTRASCAFALRSDFEAFFAFPFWPTGGSI